jgi:hypothetical protein
MVQTTGLVSSPRFIAGWHCYIACAFLLFDWLAGKTSDKT